MLSPLEKSIMIKIKILIFGVFISLSLFAQQEEEVSGLVTDRPDQTESATIVPKGHFHSATFFLTNKVYEQGGKEIAKKSNQHQRCNWKELMHFRKMPKNEIKEFPNYSGYRKKEP